MATFTFGPLANATLTEIVNVKSTVYAGGAAGDGVADDTAALNAAHAAVPDGGGIYYPPGVYCTTDTIQGGDSANVQIFSLGGTATIRPKAGSNFAGKVVLNLAGARYPVLRHIGVASTLTGSSMPKAGVVFGRTGAGSGAPPNSDGSYGGGEHCYFSGKYSLTSVYNCAAEVMAFWNCNFQADAFGSYVYMDVSDDADYDLTNGTSNSNSEKLFYGCKFKHYAEGSTAVTMIYLGGDNVEHSYHNCYFPALTSGRVYTFQMEATSLRRLVIAGGRYEQNNGSTADSRLIYANKPNGQRGIKVLGFNFAPTAGSGALPTHAIEAVTAITESEFDWFPDKDIGLLKVGSGATCSANTVRGKLAGRIDVASGGAFKGNDLTTFNSGDVFTGAGDYTKNAVRTALTTGITDTVT